MITQPSRHACLQEFAFSEDDAAELAKQGVSKDVVKAVEAAVKSKSEVSMIRMMYSTRQCQPCTRMYLGAWNECDYTNASTKLVALGRVG